MKAYVDMRAAPGGWVAEVVTEQDYRERGLLAHSHRTMVCSRASAARARAVEWCKHNGYTVAPVKEVAR